MLNVIYGPVNSRRMGRSLGINLGAPEQKICTWGCVYCQCGFGERRSVRLDDHIPSADDVIHALEASLSSQKAPIDCVTFAGNTEPTGHPDFPEIIRRVKEYRKQSGGTWILNCLSNGSELDQKRVVEACEQLDEVWFKLDCATERAFQRLSRPVAKVGNVHAHIERLKRLRNVRIQTLLWKSSVREDLGNWNQENQLALIRAYQEIKPVEVHITTIERAPATNGLIPVPKLELMQFGDEVIANGICAKTFP